VIDTFAYNGTVPGPVLRLREGRQVSIDIRNDTDIDDIIHWHGLYVPSAADGAMEEGSPMVERGGAQRYTFSPKPTGTRWYHSHNMAKTDLRRSLYSGMYGFLIVEPASDPGRYDQEVLLAAHHWEGSWVSMQDIRRGPPPDNGLEVMYASASFNDKMLGHGEPVRVREGQRVLFRLLNASPTENVTVALAASGSSAGSRTRTAKWGSESSSNTPISGASRSGWRRRPLPGTTRFSAARARYPPPTNVSNSFSKKCRAAAAATIAGPSTANRGLLRIRCSPPSAASAIASP
jgi:hypothetical protein